MSEAPIGYLFHWSSRKLVHPSGGSSNPENDTKLVLHDSKSNPGRLQFRFVAVDGAGHYGYIEHVSSGKIVHPSGGSVIPTDDTELVLHSGRHAGALFGFDEDNTFILHKSGKLWHPYGGSGNPPNDTILVLHSAVHDSAKFYLGDLDGNPLSPYPKSDISGDWKLLKAFITPLANHKYTETYRVGKSKTESETNIHAWNVSAGFAKDLFSANASYSTYAEHTSSQTWSEETEKTFEINVSAGQSVWVWQYVFKMFQYGDEITFASSIVGDTDSQDKRPVLK